MRPAAPNTARDVLQLIEQQRATIRQFGVKEIGVFGSFARGENRSTSDVDVLVELEPERETFHDYMDLLFFLEDLFGKKVDLVMKDTIKPLIRNRVLRETIYVPGF